MDRRVRLCDTSTFSAFFHEFNVHLTSCRVLDEPRPNIVGIGWVVECVEKRVLADEARFTVDITNMHVAGASSNKVSSCINDINVIKNEGMCFSNAQRRKSFLPRQIHMGDDSTDAQADSEGSGSSRFDGSHDGMLTCMSLRILLNIR